MPSTIRCQFAMGNNKSQQEKKQKSWNIKQNMINEIKIEYDKWNKNIGPGNGLLPDDTKSLPQPMLTSH